MRAAEMLAKRGKLSEARATLSPALALDGPTAATQIAHARLLHAAGDIEAARIWYRGGSLRAPPDAALILELAALEQEAGQADDAAAMTALAVHLRWWSPEAVAAAGRRLAAMGRHDLGSQVLAALFLRGHRDPGLVADLLLYGDDASLDQPLDAKIPGGPTLRVAAEAAAAHDLLADAYGDGGAADCCARREQSTAWIAAADVRQLLNQRIADRQPFSWIRLNDGEARFLVWRKAALRLTLAEQAAAAVGRSIWSIWFGQDIDAVDAADLEALDDAFDRTVIHADLLGVPTQRDLADDSRHHAYFAALSHYLAHLPPRQDRRFTAVGTNLLLNEEDAFLCGLLGGLDFLGVISPHADLADRLQRRLGIGETASYVLPGEGRLARDNERHNRGRHFPEVYRRVANQLAVPRPGAVFLVAGGLLGKIYCHLVRQRGGIALDIGALADAWVGINTRGAPLDLAMRAVLPA